MRLIKFFVYLQAISARVPAMLFLALYVALIPLFAAYYDLRASEFFHSTARYEADILLDGAQVRQDLEKAVQDQFIKANGGTTKRSGDWVIDIREFRVNGAHFNDGRLHLKTYMRFKGTRNNSETAGPKIFDISIRPDLIVGLRGDPDQHVLKFPQSQREDSWPVPDQEIFPNPSNSLARSGTLIISPDLQSRITNLHNSFRGFPALSSGAYQRMLYFSAVTQTTLGYGDVVPISDRTRLAVALQAVLGIIMIGLFLNSLATGSPVRRRRRSD